MTRFKDPAVVDQVIETFLGRQPLGLLQQHH
jgi:hypothetical protein